MRAPAILLAAVLLAQVAAASPFAGCKGQQSDDATFFACGNVLASSVEFPEGLKDDEVESNLAGFEGQFPDTMPRRRETVTYAGKKYPSTLVEGPKGRARMVIVKLAKGARVVTCARRGPPEGPERCDAMLQELVTKGPPKGEKPER